MPEGLSDSETDETAADTAAENAAVESEIRAALRGVVDPELGLDVIALGLIRAIDVRSDVVDISMIFTTPFCPYGGILLQQVKDRAAQVAAREVTVSLLEDTWSPDMMEGGDWSEWGLI